MYSYTRSVVLSLAPLFFAVSAFPQAEPAFVSRVIQIGEEAAGLTRDVQIPGLANDAALVQGAGEHQMSDLDAQESLAMRGHEAGEPSTGESLVVRRQSTKPPDWTRDIYYRNKLEFSLDGGWLPINIPFPLDVFVGDSYNTYPLKYTLVPIIASLRWQINGLGGPWILRGNWDLTCSGSITAIPRGPESRYFAYLMGIRRNFVPHNSRIAPYFDIRLGLGNIDAKGPYGVKYAQGEDFTFTVNMGSGLRYTLSPRYAISAGLNFMHLSNLDLSQGNGINGNWGIRNYGINVYGPMVGIDIRLSKHQRHAVQ